MLNAENYEAVIGLEVHVQLLTKSKLFSNDSASFSSLPNTHVSPIVLAHPGTLPRLNGKAVEYALQLGTALECDIAAYTYFARKHYFYPDLPKGYQVSQHTSPICKNGFVNISTKNGDKRIALNRIHLEEDAGKSIHDKDDNYTSIDLNRAGVPLLEIVTEPVMHESSEAFSFITEIRKIVRYLGICDGNMEEGSLRCDANISIRKRGDKSLGTKVEIKNLNSIRNVRRAIDVEIERLIGLAENGEHIYQETRSYDPDKNTTSGLRVKEEADDYRYFPEPDLPPVCITTAMLDKVKKEMPSLPAVLQLKYQNDFNLSAYDASSICNDKYTSDYFESVILFSNNHKAIANWILGPLRAYLNDHNTSSYNHILSPERLSQLIDLIDTGKVSFSIATTKVFPIMLERKEVTPLDIATEMNLVQEANEDMLQGWIDEVINAMPDKIAAYKKGKKGLLALFAGEVKKVSKGKADMKVITTLLTEKLNN